jgi:hypothetical protein
MFHYQFYNNNISHLAIHHIIDNSLFYIFLNYSNEEGFQNSFLTNFHLLTKNETKQNKYNMIMDFRIKICEYLTFQKNKHNVPDKIIFDIQEIIYQNLPLNI